ncbi:MAG: cupin [Chloroflexi bacterium]|nr:cupin [Chloroflexota bacterium]
MRQTTRSQQTTVRVVRWRGGQHPTLALMKQNLENHGLRPFKWSKQANYRYGVRSHGYTKSLYCVEGSVEIFVPESRQRITLRVGDRVDIPKGVRHSITVGQNGATCLEGTPARHRPRALATQSS